METKSITRHKTGVHVQYNSILGTKQDIEEWKCPVCCHRWFEYADADEYPEVCPLCGSYFEEEEP